MAAAEKGMILLEGRKLMTSSIADQTLDQLSINTLRLLAVDTVEKAKSGHPGAPLGCAPIAYLLFNKLLKHNPAHAKWADRDRFVLSNGHASSLLYGTLFLSGYDVTLDDLKSFRQWGSRTPGHPERGETDGVEVTTGPLGQGIAMAVGMAIAEKHLAAVYNRPGFEVVDHHTYALLGDGDLMEGVSHEAASLAGTLGLGKLIFLYDDNHISLDGPTSLSYTEDALKRFEAYHWHVQRVADVNDLPALEAAIKAAKAETGRPSIIAVRTIIGYGSPKEGSNKAHGEPLGAEGAAATKEFFGFPTDQSFVTPEAAVANWRKAVARGTGLEENWKKLFANYAAVYPEPAAEFERTQKGALRAGWEKAIPSFAPDKPQATRSAGGVVLNAIADAVPELIGGAADLTGRAEHLFWRARVRHGRGGERHCGARRADSLRLDLFCLFRLRQTGDAAGGADAGAFALHLHARLDCRGRGRADARTGGATAGPAGNSGADGLSAGGRQRNGGGLPAGFGTHRTELLCAQPAEFAGDRSGGTRRLRRGEQGRVCAGRRGRSAGGSDRRGLRALALRGRSQAAGGRGHPRAGGELPELGDLRRADGRV
jgi:transketolase N-terminal domain/subunit